MKIMLVIPKRLERPGLVFPIVPHLGVAYLAAMLKKSNAAVKIVDMRLGYAYKDLLRFLDQFNPSLVGVTSYSYAYKRSYEVVDAIKSQGNCPVVLGGPHVSAIRSKALSETRADFAIKGEGEYSLLELCECIENQGRDYEKIRSLIWRDGDAIVENEDRLYLQQHELDNLPFPAYEEFELEKYKKRRLGITTSRGCPYRCIFCSVRLSMGNRFRPRSPENVLNEIEDWYEKGWEEFDINDDCFSVDMGRAKKICDLIVERGFKIRYSCYNGLRVDLVDRELLQKMKESGCDFISYGVESGNNEVLRAIKKGITIQQVERAVEITNEVGIKNAGTFIIGHPGETLEKAMDTIKFAERLPFRFVSFYNLVPYPGTELYDWIKEKATFRYPPEVHLNQLSCGEIEPIFETKEFPAEERVRVLKLGFSLHWKTLTQSSLGKVAGRMAYQIVRFDTLRRLLGKMITESKISSSVFRKLTR
ncbi:tRNA-2-methylthio-N(6)-dimethylallyladenosine synthase [subsurface metagenome]